jgi:general stress protein 26
MNTKNLSLDLIRSTSVFYLATVDSEGRPHVRLMAGKVIEEPLTIYLSTFATARKMQQITDNPRCQLLFHLPDYQEVVTVNAIAEKVTDPLLKARLYDLMQPGVKYYFSSSEDPNFGVIKCSATSLERITSELHRPDRVEI